MATSTGYRSGREILVESGPLLALVGACTALLTAAFVGVVGVASGNATGLVARLPLYVLAGAVIFVGVLFTYEGQRLDGRTTLGRSVVCALAGFALVALGGEGVVFALTHPDLVVASHLIVYLLAAAVIASGLGYWLVRHWREVTRTVDASGL